MILSERAQFLVDNLDLSSASGVENARWEHFQLAHLSDDSILRCDLKSRQIAASFTYAAEAVANAILYKTSSLFQSINLDEAREKIIYARAILDNLKIKGLPEITQPDTTTVIGFDNGARIISSPGTPQRGKARFWVYLDEWGWQKHDRANYTAAFPIISKGGKLRGASSPSGSAGLFWEIYTQSLRPYPGFTRESTQWWKIYSFCVDVKGAIFSAPKLSTKERVEQLGNERIQLIYNNMPEDEFRQEYECAFVDENSSWIPWEIIKQNQDDQLFHYHAKSVDEAVGLIESIRTAINQGKIEHVLSGGIDVGRKKDLTEFAVLGKSTTGQLPLRFMVSLDQVSYDAQEHCFAEIINRLPFTTVFIDQNGIGAQLAENLQRKTGKAQGVNFTNATKELWAVEAKVQAERNNTPIPVARDLAYQIHSIKKKMTASKNNVFDTERNEKHHADKFWAWALAISAANASTYQVVSEEW